MSQSIDWAYWKKLPEIRAFEAIALLLGAEPESEPPEDSSLEYRRALRLLLACMSDRSMFTPGMLNMGDPALSGVKLIEVGAWAKAHGYLLPDKFPRPVQLSDAPEPISRVSGRNATRPHTLAAVPAVDWAFWRNMRTVKLWQACALVLGLEPDRLKPHPQQWMAGAGAGRIFEDRNFPNLEIKERFGKALRLAENAVSYMDGPIYPQGTPHPGNNQEKDVLLSQVVAFFVACDWADIPEPLQSIAQPAAPVTTQESTEVKALSVSVAVPKQRAQENRIIELLKAQGYEPLKLAQRAAGKPGPKAEIRTLALNEPKFFTQKTFNTAWQRLRDAGELAGAE